LAFQPHQPSSPHSLLNKISHKKISHKKHKSRASIETTPFATSEKTLDKTPSRVPTAEMPTPEMICDNTGYSFSAVTLGSNPLYNWKTCSESTATTNREKAPSSLNTSEEWSDKDGGGRAGAGHGTMDRRGFEESETVHDFRVWSIDSGSDKKTRRRPSWLPGIGIAQKQENSPHQEENGRGAALELSVALSNISGSHA